MKIYSLLACCCLLLTCSYISNEYQKQSQFKQHHTDYAELNNIRYGLLNANSWKPIIATQLSSKIEDFELGTSDRRALKKELEQSLHTLLKDAENIIDKKVHEGNALNQFVRQVVVGFIKTIAIDFDDLHKEVPSVANNILNELERPEMKNKLKDVVLHELNQWIEESGQHVSDRHLSHILKHHKMSDIKSFNQHFEDINQQHHKSNLSVLLMQSLLFCLMTALLYRDTHRRTAFIYTIFLCTLFLAGVFIPMMRIYAELESIEFILLNKRLVFEHQALFYQHKSLADILKLLFSQTDGQGRFVGGIILVFSVLFPAIKLLLSAICIYTRQYTNNVVLRWLVLHSSKWSMIDVFVVSIFLSFLGFESLVSNALKAGFSNASTYQPVIDTHYTSLEPGFFYFFLFVLGSGFMSLYIKNLHQDTDLTH